MLAVLFWTMLAIVGLIVILALLPLRVRVVVRSAPRAHARVELRLFGGLSPWIGIFDSARSGRPEMEEPEGAQDHEEAKAPKRKKGRARRVDVWRMIGALPDLARGLLRVFRVDRLDVEGVFGLGDPADTGAAYGMIAPPLVAAGYALGRPHAVRVTPDFDRLAVEGRAEAEITVMPARAVPPALRFLWTVFGPRR